MSHYHVCGLTVESEFDLGAPAARGESAPQVVVRSGRVPPQLLDAVDRTRSFQTARDRLLLTIGDGRCLVHHGREILVQAKDVAATERMRPYLTGSAFAALLQQRGDLPLHASSIRVGDAAVAFCGVSGTGKSTLAAALLQRGYDVLSDDLSAVHIGSDRHVTISSGFCRIKLHADAVHRLGMSARSAATELASGKLEFRSMPSASSPLPLRRLYVLSSSAIAASPAIRPVSDGLALALLRKHTFRRRFLAGMGRITENFQACATLLQSLDIFLVQRPVNLHGVPELVDRLEEHWRTESCPLA